MSDVKDLELLKARMELEKKRVDLIKEIVDSAIKYRLFPTGSFDIDCMIILGSVLAFAYAMSREKY